MQKNERKKEERKKKDISCRPNRIEEDTARDSLNTLRLYMSSKQQQIDGPNHRSREEGNAAVGIGAGSDDFIQLPQSSRSQNDTQKYRRKRSCKRNIC
jgi:hypothetical protein